MSCSRSNFRLRLKKNRKPSFISMLSNAYMVKYALRTFSIFQQAQTTTVVWLVLVPNQDKWYHNLSELWLTENEISAWLINGFSIILIKENTLYTIMYPLTQCLQLLQKFSFKVLLFKFNKLNICLCKEPSYAAKHSHFFFCSLSFSPILYLFRTFIKYFVGMPVPAPKNAIPPNFM